jgi:hypothetical protein
MAILAALLAAGSRFAGKILTTALGWASTLLFGRVSGSRQYLLLAITFGSVIWMVLLAGVVLPDVGTFLLVFVPDQDLVPEEVIRALMLIGAAIVPGVLGGLTLLLTDTERTPRRIAGAVARGYPLTALLAVLLVFLAGLAGFRKARSLARGWTDAHVPLVVQPGRYDDVAADLERALDAAGLEVERTPAPAVMSKPAQWLAMVAGGASASLVPQRMIQLDGTDLDILIYPMDLLISGDPKLVSRARAAMASRLTTSAAHMTVSAEGQEVEDRLTRLARPSAETPDIPRRFDDAAAAELASIDEVIAELEIPYEEWEVLYRERLQVERDLRAGAMAGDAVVGADSPGLPPDGLGETLGDLGRLVRAGVAAVADSVADERTAEVIDRMAGSRWRWAARVASVAAVAAREFTRTTEPRAGNDEPRPGNGHRSEEGGRPADVETRPDDRGSGREAVSRTVGSRTADGVGSRSPG